MYCDFQFTDFSGTLEYISECVSDSSAFSWASFPSIGLSCPTLTWRFWLIVNRFYFVMFCCCLLETCSFLLRDRKDMVPNERWSEVKLAGVEGGKVVIRIYFMGKYNLFSIKRKSNKARDEKIKWDNI